MAENQELNIVVKLVDQASQGLKGMSDSLDKFWKKVDEQTQGAQTFTKAIIWTAAVVWGVAVNKFMDFEKTMSGVKAVLSPTIQEFDKLNEKAKQLWKDSIYSQSEVAQSIEMLAKNGLDATQILNGAADATVNLAAAAGTDLSTAADLATDTMAIFGIQAENISRAINGISGVAVASKFTVDDYRLALAQGWWVAKAVWVQFEDFNTAIAAISPLFASGSDAGTSYKVFLQRLVPASNQAAEAMQNLWLMTADGKNQFFDATGKLKSMGEISGILQKSLKGLSDEQKNQALQTIFGTDAMRAAVGLADTGAEKFAELNAQIQGTDAAEQAKTRLDNLAGSFEQLMGTLDVILIDFWAAISTVLRPAIDWLTNALEDVRATFQGLSPEMQTTLSVIAGVAAGFAGLLLVVGSIWIILPAVTAALSAIAGALAFLISPVGLVIAAVAALAIAWQTNFLGIQETTAQVFEALKPYFEVFKQDLLELWNTAKVAFDGIKAAVMAVFEFLQPYIMAALQIIKDFWTAHFADIMNIVMGTWEIIKGLFQGAFDIISGIFQIFAGLFTGNWQLLWDGIVLTITGVWEVIKWVFSWAFQVIQWALGIFGGIIKAVWEALWLAFKGLTQAGWNAITAVVSLAWEGLKWLVNLWGEAISSAWTATMEGIKGVAEGIWSTIKNIFATGINWVIDKINGLINSINSVSGAIGVPAIPTIWRLQFQKWGIVPEHFQTGWIVAGGKLPANHDQIPAMLDPGELILNRAQQKNLASQMTSGQAVNAPTININFSWNAFYGEDDFMEKIGDKIVKTLQTHISFASF
jgi:TP901 family phage tail tape measure protein